MSRKYKIAFICVHNSCRSQIAEALCRETASDIFEAYSAGTEIKDGINKDAVRIMKREYNIDMTANQYPKLLSDIPPADIVITMGCNVRCPVLPCLRREDWGLSDPTGKDDSAFLDTIFKIRDKIAALKKEYSQKQSFH